MQSIDSQKEYARALHERVRREFPEVRILAPYIMCTQYQIYLFIYPSSTQLRIYKFWEKPIGPHPVAMFEVNTFTPHQTGAFFSWLAVHRGPCSYVTLIY